MADELLQRLMEAGLLDIGEGDARYESVKKTAAALSNAFKSKPREAMPAILVAIDPNVDDIEPALEMAESALKAEWKTLRGLFKDRPTQILRSLLLDACDRAATESNRAAAVIWLTAANVLPYARLGREEPLVREVLARAASRAETWAVQKSAPAKNEAASKAQPPPNKFKPVVAPALKNVEKLVAQAAGPTSDGNADVGGDKNQHWPNSGHPWAWQFSPRMAKAITQPVSAALQELVNGVNDSLGSAGTLLDDIKQEQQRVVREAGSMAGSMVASLSQRLDVLWWAETLYSPTLGQSYRSLKPELAALAMPSDLLRSLSAPLPASITYMLGETIGKLPGATFAERRSLVDIVQLLRVDGAAIRWLFSAPAAGPGRRPLVDLLEGIVHGSPDEAESILRRSGLPSDASLTLPEIGMWCFRNLQARRIADSPE